jgi:hypothetical protein
MTESVLRLVDNLGITFGFALLFAAAGIVGSAACLAWRPDHRDGWVEAAERSDRLAGMTVGEFFRRVTLQTRQGKLFLWLSAANLALAAALPLLPEKAQDNPMAPFLWFWPLFLFIYHLFAFWKFGSGWFSLFILSMMALIPGWNIVVVTLLGIR